MLGWRGKETRKGKAKEWKSRVLSLRTDFLVQIKDVDGMAQDWV